MVTFNMSYTAPINPPQLKPKLAMSQVWACLDAKVRHAQMFVPAITNTEIISEERIEGGGFILKRRVTFAPGGHPAGDKSSLETCRFYKPCRVDFVHGDGSIITNIVSKGPTGEPDDLWYTYVFEWRHEGIKDEHSPEAEAQELADWRVTKLAVEATIEQMRRMAKDGSIPQGG